MKLVQVVSKNQSANLKVDVTWKVIVIILDYVMI